MNASVCHSFTDEKPLCSDIKEEIKDEVEETECLFLPVVTEDDLLTEHVSFS